MSGSSLWDLAAIGLLFIAAWFLHGTAGYHRYGYYQSLRDWVTIAWLVAGFRFWVHRWYPATVLAIATAVLFNPVIPVTMRKWQWQPYDHWTMIFSILAAIALVGLAYRSKPKETAS